jgi:hypothetical protein
MRLLALLLILALATPACLDLKAAWIMMRYAERETQK